MLILSIIGLILSSLIEIIILGMGLYIIIGRKCNIFISIILYMMIFLIIDLLLWPTASYLKIALVVYNREITDFLDLPYQFFLPELLSPDLFDIVIYLLKSVIVYFIGKYIYNIYTAS